MPRLAHPTSPVRKTCGRCGTGFACGPERPGDSCWCDKYPPILTPIPDADCLCPRCLAAELRPRIAAYIAAIPKALRPGSPATRLARPGVLVEGIDYYVEGQLWVFTAWYHLKRGACCGHACRHCPY